LIAINSRVKDLNIKAKKAKEELKQTKGNKNEKLRKRRSP
jgi:hypothetical protein